MRRQRPAYRQPTTSKHNERGFCKNAAQFICNRREMSYLFRLVDEHERALAQRQRAFISKRNWEGTEKQLTQKHIKRLLSLSHRLRRALARSTTRYSHRCVCVDREYQIQQMLDRCFVSRVFVTCNAPPIVLCKRTNARTHDEWIITQQRRCRTVDELWVRIDRESIYAKTNKHHIHGKSSMMNWLTELTQQSTFRAVEFRLL